jgi:hypothetical protein
MRVGWVGTQEIWIPTTVGTVSGEIWSDRLVGIGLIDDPQTAASAEAEGTVSGPDDLAELIRRLGVPEPEASAVAHDYWQTNIAPAWERWSAKSNRPGILTRIRRRFANLS